MEVLETQGEMHKQLKLMIFCSHDEWHQVTTTTGWLGAPIVLRGSGDSCEQTVTTVTHLERGARFGGLNNNI